jgi:hypothetical protein
MFYDESGWSEDDEPVTIEPPAPVTQEINWFEEGAMKKWWRSLWHSKCDTALAFAQQNAYDWKKRYESELSSKKEWKNMAEALQSENSIMKCALDDAHIAIQDDPKSNSATMEYLEKLLKEQDDSGYNKTSDYTVDGA